MMDYVGIICEFNPFHNGHKYLIEKARELSGGMKVALIMSGNFVQRAEPSVLSKQAKTEIALKNGADLVVELPVAFAVSAANTFASGAINIASQIPNIKYLAFGSENPDEHVLQTLADIQTEESSDFKSIFNSLLKSGLSYPAAHSEATVMIAEKYNILPTISRTVLTQPNNLLATEYLKLLKKYAPHIQPMIIQRIGSNYHDHTITHTLSSATALRQCIYSGNSEKTKDNMPPSAYKILRKEVPDHLPDLKIFESMILKAIRESDDLSYLLDSAEGLDTKLKQNAETHTNLIDVIEKTKSKRYTYARIKRLCLQALLNINKMTISVKNPLPVKVLGIKNEIRQMLSQMPQTTIIQNADYFKKQNAFSGDYLKTEKIAANTYSLITHMDGDFFYGHKLIVD